MLQQAPSSATQDHDGRSKNLVNDNPPFGRPSMPSLRARTSRLKFFASSSTPKPEDRRLAWEKEYLNDLRSNRPVRPSGARPPPNQTTSFDETVPETPLRASSAMAFRPSLPLRQTSPSRLQEEERCSSALSHQLQELDVSVLPSMAPDHARLVKTRSISPVKGRPSAEEYSARSTLKDTHVAMRTPSGLYKEREQRLAEKEEARMLREALEIVDLKEEARVHSAAQAEASDLVWEHLHRVPSRIDPTTPFPYKQRLRSINHSRSQSDVPGATRSKLDDGQECIQRPASERSDIDHVSKKQEEWAANEQTRALQAQAQSPESIQQNTSSKNQGPISIANNQNQLTNGHALWDSPNKKAYMNLSFSLPQVKNSGRRRSSGSKTRTPSGSLFRNPDDKIYEEPEEIRPEPGPVEIAQGVVFAPLRSTTRNPVPKIESTIQPCLRSMTDPVESKGRYSQTEIHRNPPSQSRNPSYLQNETLPTSPNETNDKNAQVSNVASEKGVEVRSDDIKAATSMRLRDRSPKLPCPTIVSNVKGRPIVSFDKNWRPSNSDEKLQESSERHSSSRDGVSHLPATVHSKPPLAKTIASAPAVPTISIGEPPSIKIDEAPSVPSISVSTIPSISFSAEGTSSASSTKKSKSSRPLPTPSKKPGPTASGRPLPHHSATAPVHTSVPHWSPSQRRATAQCAACALPISGRIVSASSQRFHPECFTCFHCSEQLECVAFYPEPDTFRNDRIARIRGRTEGAEIPDEPGKTQEDDGDESLRFFCHLDFHEKFSPRCRSCKTPIEGEVVVACGGEWHVGHFFCAQCGDPFDQKTPFVEKDGYAWCVGCHTNRFSGKCRGCKKPVVDLVVRALGGEWHESCFCCKVRFKQFSLRT